LEKKIIIAKCVRCGKLLLSKIGTKTKMCPYCNMRFSLDAAVIVARLDSAREAKIMLAELKRRRAQGQMGSVRPQKLGSESFS
jgi:RNA polymerase subunit RPABC4/transcription elongation factor Spt4